MWKKTLGLVALLFALILTTVGCTSSHRGYYRSGYGYAPVNVRVVRPAYRYYGPNRYHYKEHRKHDKRRHRDHDRDSRRWR